jgi:hypothetical protein
MTTRKDLIIILYGILCNKFILSFVVILTLLRSMYRAYKKLNLVMSFFFYRMNIQKFLCKTFLLDLFYTIKHKVEIAKG